MPIETINIGSAANDQTGDSFRSGGNKINENFSFLENHRVSGQCEALRNVSYAAEGSIRVIEYFGGYFWGVNLSTWGIHKSLTGVGDWTTVRTTGTSGTHRILPCNDGEILIATGAQVLKSSGWATNPQTATFTEKCAVTPGGANYLEWGIDGNGEKFIVVEYAGGTQGSDEWGTSRYVKISTDEGDTFSVIYDGVAQYGTTQNKQSHLHAAAYDPTSDTFFWIEGHGTQRGIYYSDDDGGTFARINVANEQASYPTTLTVTEWGLVVGTDNIVNGILHMRRTADWADADFETGWIAAYPQAGLTMFANRAFKDPDTGIVYIGYNTAQNNVPTVIAASDGRTAALVHTIPDSSTAGCRVWTLVAAQGKLIARFTDESATSKTLVADTGGYAVRDITIEDTGGALGGTVPEINRGRSAAVGPGSVADGDLALAAGPNCETTADSSVGSGVSVILGAGFCAVHGYDFEITEDYPYCTGVAVQPVIEAPFATFAGYQPEVRATGGAALGAGAVVQVGHDRAVAIGQDSESIEADSVSAGNRRIESTSNTRSLVTRSLKSDRYHRTINHFGRVVNQNLFGGSGFDPRDLPNIGAWWKIADITDTNKEFDPTDLTADHLDTIKTVNQKAGSNKLLGTIGTGPVLYHDRFNGRQAAYFDGTMQMATHPGASSATATIFIVMKPEATSGKYIVFYPDTLFSQLLIADTTDSSFAPHWETGSPTYRLNGATADFSTRKKLFDATNNVLSVITIEGVDLSTNWPQTSSGLRIANFGSGFSFKGYIAEIIIVNGTVSSENRAATEAYLMNEYITTLRNSYYWDGPTADPGIAGQIYCDASDGNTFKMSAG